MLLPVLYRRANKAPFRDALRHEPRLLLFRKGVKRKPFGGTNDRSRHCQYIMKPFHLPLPRETERLALRTPLLTDAAAIQEALEESFADLRIWMDWATALQSIDDTRAHIEQHQTNYMSAEDFTVSAFLKDSGKFVLNAGLHPRNWRVPKFEIGYWCRTSMQGNGYVTEVVRELTSAAFRDMAAKRVEIRCDSRNQRSRRVAERVGYRLEAILRCDDRANDDSIRDTVIYTLVAEDLQPEAQTANAT